MLTDYLVPRNTMFDVGRRMNRFFADMAPEMRGWPFGSLCGCSVPASNVWENQDAYFVELAAPGVAEDNVALSMVGSELTVQLIRPEMDETKKEGHFWRQERCESESSLSFSFPTAVDAQAVSADLQNGVLLIKIPKAEKQQVKKICVNKTNCKKA